MKSKLVFVSLLVALMAVFAVSAQENPASPVTTITFDGVSVNFDPAFALGVNLTRYAGDPADLQQPGGAEPPYTQFIYYDNLPVPEHAYDAKVAVRVYDIISTQAYPETNAQVASLSTLLSTRVDLNAYQTVTDIASDNALPFLPVAPAAQIIRARAEYIELPNMSGIHYITAYRQDASPFLSNDFTYTFQGITDDGTRYISVTAPLNVATFPADFPADFDNDAFVAGMTEYLNQSIAQINTGADSDFTPTLSELGALVNSLAYAPVTVASVEPTESAPIATTEPSGDPTLGGLAGSWDLISYGAVDAQVNVVEGSLVTANFTAQGVSGNASCNSYSANFTYNNNQLSVTMPVSTLMACLDEGISQQEAAYLTAFAAANSYQVIGNSLQISYTDADGVNGMLVYVRANTAIVDPVVTPSADTTFGGLVGSWNLVSFGTSDEADVTLTEAPINATFSTEGVAGNAGCNTYSAAFSYNNGVLSISPAITTRMACAENVMTQETVFLNALTTISTYSVSEGTLTINYVTADGINAVLTFTSAA